MSLRSSGLQVHPSSRPLAQLRTSPGRQGVFSRHHLPEVLHFVGPHEIRGRREDRLRAAPAVSQACCKRIGCLRAYRFSGEPPAFPAQWLYGLYEIVMVPRFSSTIVRSRLSPLADLTPASGRRTQTISPYARPVFAKRLRRAQPRSSVATLRPPLPVPRLRRWPTPLWWDRMTDFYNLFCLTGPAIYF